MFYIIESSMGFAGDEEFDVIEAGSEGVASEIKFEDLQQNISAHSVESFETEEEADNWMEEKGYC